jgi:hypothetical protein
VAELKSLVGAAPASVWLYGGIAHYSFLYVRFFHVLDAGRVLVNENMLQVHQITCARMWLLPYNPIIVNIGKQQEFDVCCWCRTAFDVRLCM